MCGARRRGGGVLRRRRRRRRRRCAVSRRWRGGRRRRRRRRHELPPVRTMRTTEMGRLLMIKDGGDEQILRILRLRLRRHQRRLLDGADPSAHAGIVGPGTPLVGAVRLGEPISGLPLQLLGYDRGGGGDIENKSGRCISRRAGERRVESGGRGDNELSHSSIKGRQNATKRLRPATHLQRHSTVDAGPIHEP